LEVGLELPAHLGVDRSGTDLTDAQVGMSGGQVLRRGQHGPDDVARLLPGSAGSIGGRGDGVQADGEDDGPAVPRRRRFADGGDAGDAHVGTPELLAQRTHLSLGEGAEGARHDDRLGRTVTEVGAFTDLDRVAGVADELVGGSGGPQAAAEEDDGAGEDEQSGEEGAPAVLGAPLRGAPTASRAESSGRGRAAPDSRWEVVVMTFTLASGGVEALVRPGGSGGGTAPPPGCGVPQPELAGQHRRPRPRRCLRWWS
jgi:hypothetical protein